MSAQTRAYIRGRSYGLTPAMVDLLLSPDANNLKGGRGASYHALCRRGLADYYSISPTRNRFGVTVRGREVREILARDSDRSGEAMETRSGSTEGESAGAAKTAHRPDPVSHLSKIAIDHGEQD